MRLLVVFLFLLSVVLFENCGSNSGSGFNLNSSSLSSTSTGLVPLTASPIQLASTALTASQPFSATTLISGSNLSGLTCLYTITNSFNQVVSSAAGTIGSAGTTCSTALTAPSTGGSFQLSVTITNSGGETSVSYALFSVAATTGATPTPTLGPTPVQTATPGPTPTPTPTAAPTPVAGCTCHISETDGGSKWQVFIAAPTQAACYAAPACAYASGSCNCGPWAP